VLAGGPNWRTRTSPTYAANPRRAFRSIGSFEAASRSINWSISPRLRQLKSRLAAFASVADAAKLAAVATQLAVSSVCATPAIGLSV
jgi:hypothetical protein